MRVKATGIAGSSANDRGRQCLMLLPLTVKSLSPLRAAKADPSISNATAGCVGPSPVSVV